MSDLRVESVTIRNIKAITELEFTAGTVTVISGRNGVGKSSVLDALAAVFEGGHDPGLLRRGAQAGSVTIGLSDGVTIKKTITPKQSTVKVTTATGGLVKGPQSYVKALTHGMAFDPVAFVEAKPRERLAFLLAAMPIEFSADSLRGALAGRAPLAALDLAGFNSLLDGLSDQRTENNRALKQLDATIEQLEKALPADAETDWRAEADRLQGKATEAEKSISAMAGERDVWIETEKAGKIREHAEKVEVLRREMVALDKARDEAVREVELKGARIYEESVAETWELLQQLSADLATARQKAEEATRAQATRESVQGFRGQAASKQATSEELTTAIENMRALKQGVLSDLPIPDVDIRDGEVYVADTPWPHVNTSEQYMVAAQVSALEPSVLPFRVLDRAEQLDEERFEALRNGYEEAGLQLAVARVTEDEELVVNGAN
jgi:energy-coupling factor transporter ATP-binding protein EcfA2